MFNSSSTLLSFQLSRAYISKTNLNMVLSKPKTKQKYLCDKLTLVYLGIPFSFKYLIVKLIFNDE